MEEGCLGGGGSVDLVGGGRVGVEMCPRWKRIEVGGRMQGYLGGGSEVVG